MDIELNKNKIVELLLTIERDGMNDLVDYLENRTDFFIAPASSKYHGNYPRGVSRTQLKCYEFIKREK